MHPADQVEAFRRLADAGSTAGAIAARFGVSERTVEKRLRLGNAAPVLLEAYRAGEIDLDTLMAFAVTTDQARQSAVWETVSQQGYRPGAWQIKRLLTEDRVSATSAIARFVGIEAYEAAGGKDRSRPVRRRGRAGDLVRRSRSLEQSRHGQPPSRGEGTGDALEMGRGAARHVDWSATAAFGRVRPQPAEPTGRRRRPRSNACGAATTNSPAWTTTDWTEEPVEEADANETRLDEIEAMIKARAIYRREDIAIAGCIATVGNDGELKLIQGLVRPEDMPAREARRCGRRRTRRYRRWTRKTPYPASRLPHFAAPLASPGDAEAEARKEVGVGIGLADDSAGHPHGHRQEPARLRLRGGLRFAAVPARPQRVHQRLP